jgi:hypothetical protein
MCVYDIIMAAAATVIITCEARCVRIDKYCARARHDLREDLLKGEKKTKWRERITTISLYVAAAAASKHNNNNKNNNTRIG